MRATAEQEEIDGVHPEKVCEMGLSVSCKRRVCRFNKQGAWLNHDVGEFVKQSAIIEVETLRHQQSILPRNSTETLYIKLLSEDRQKDGEDKVGRLIKSMNGTPDASHIWQLGCANRICGELGDFRRGKQSAALFYNPNQDVRMTIQGDFECLLEDEGLKHIDTQIQRHSQRQGRKPGFKDSNLNNLVMLNCDH